MSRLFDYRVTIDLQLKGHRIKKEIYNFNHFISNFTSEFDFFFKCFGFYFEITTTISLSRILWQVSKELAAKASDCVQA